MRQRCGPISLLAMALLLAGTAAAEGMPQGSKTKEKDKESQNTYTAHRLGERFQNRIIREVRHELVMLPWFGVFDNLAFRVEGETVTLLGQVTRPTLKSDAEAAVKRIEGIEHVKNQIEVLPVSPADDRIRRAEFQAIYGQANLNQYALRAVPPIHIIVKNGHVTLEGVVANAADKNIAGIQANGVSGVFSVTNNLQVEGR